MEKKKISKVQLSDEQKESLEVLRTNCLSTRDCIVEDYLNDDATPAPIKQALSQVINAYMNVEFLIYNFVNGSQYE